MDSDARWIEAPDTDEYSDSLPVLDRSEGEEFGDEASHESTAVLADLLVGLEHAPEESWNAFQGLEAIDSESRLQIVAELLKAPASEGLTRLLHLLGASRDHQTRAAVRQALGTSSDANAALTVPRESGAIRIHSRAGTLATTNDHTPRLIHSLVTSVDGDGAGVIVVSTIRDGVTATAAYLCDVHKGIRDVLGAVEGDPGAEAGLFEQFPDVVSGQTVEDVPALALGLLAGNLLISGRSTPPTVRQWLDTTLGGGFHSGAFLATKAEWSLAPINQAVLAERSWSVLEACPAWVDRSALTFGLAEEISLREGRAAADPFRDAGAYRFLFERRLIHRLELYQRMLLWMAFFWDAAGDAELSLSAGVLAGQLADEQYAVPAHPFAVALTTRSLHEAQRLLGTSADPRLA